MVFMPKCGRSVLKSTLRMTPAGKCRVASKDVYLCLQGMKTQVFYETIKFMTLRFCSCALWGMNNLLGCWYKSEKILDWTLRCICSGFFSWSLSLRYYSYSLKKMQDIVLLILKVKGILGFLWKLVGFNFCLLTKGKCFIWRRS